MHGNQGGGFLKKGLQVLRIAHQHMAGGRAQEQLDAANLFGFGSQYLAKIVFAAAHIKRIVDKAALRRHIVFLPQKFLRERLRFGVGHIHKGGDTAPEGRRRLGGDVALVRKAGLTEMHVVVYHAGKNISSL